MNKADRGQNNRAGSKTDPSCNRYPHHKRKNASRGWCEDNFPHWGRGYRYYSVRHSRRVRPLCSHKADRHHKMRRLRYLHRSRRVRQAERIGCNGLVHNGHWLRNRYLGCNLFDGGCKDRSDRLRSKGNRYPLGKRCWGGRNGLGCTAHWVGNRYLGCILSRGRGKRLESRLDRSDNRYLERIERTDRLGNADRSDNRHLGRSYSVVVHRLD